MSNAISTLGDFRIQITEGLADRLGVTEQEWRVLTDQIFPSANSVEAISMALSYCRVRKLDIFKKPIHIVPMYSSAKKKMVETVWPGIAEIRTTATRTGAYSGISKPTFGPSVTKTFVGSVDAWENGNRSGTKEISKTVTFPEWAEITVYRMVHGAKAEFTASVYWTEAYASIGKTSVPNDMWEKRPMGQLAKCVEAAALRMAFPEEAGGMLTAEEMEGRTIDHDDVARSVAPVPPSPPIESGVKPAPPAPPLTVAVAQGSIATTFDKMPQNAETQKPDGITDIDPSTGEVTEGASDSDFFYQLEEASMAATSMAQIAIAWDKCGVEAKFGSDPVGMDTCLAIKARAMKKIREAATV
jgi:phage recombination protein Bet